MHWQVGDRVVVMAGHPTQSGKTGHVNWVPLSNVTMHKPVSVRMDERTQKGRAKTLNFWPDELGDEEPAMIVGLESEVG